MPAENVLFKGGWSLKKFNATVINDIWPEVLFFSLIAAMVSLVSEMTPHNLAIPNGLLTVLGTVLGLVISFRTSTAYERYQDGRKMWTNITIGSRNLAQMIWIHVPSEREAKPGQPETTMLQNVIEKKSMINLVQAFSVSLKHYLRAEPGIYYRDLYPLVCILPRYFNSTRVAHTDDDLLPLWQASENEDPHPTAHVLHTPPANNNPRPGDEKVQRTTSLPTPATHHTDVQGDAESSKSWFNSLSRNRKSKKPKWDPESALSSVPASRPLKPARQPPEASMYDYIPLLRLFKWMFRRASSVAPGGRNFFGKKKKPIPVDSNVPLEVTLHLSAYTAWLMRSGLLQPAIASSMATNITMLQDTFSNLDRIRNTPLPFAYQAHLRMSLWLYLFFLPFQICSTFHYLTIPGTAFASFLLIGFLEIGQEIENPFNYDANDLDLDTFCLSIQRELHEITAHTAPEPHQYVFSAWNQPFAPTDRRTAEQLVEGGAKSYHLPEDVNKRSHGDSEDSQTTKDSLHLTLLRGWKNVDRVTRESHF